MQGQQYPGGGVPPAPPLNDADAAPAVRPKSVDTSVLLWLIAAGVSLIGQLLSFATSSEVAEEVARQSGVTVESAEPGIGGTVFSIVLLIAWVATVFAMRGGQNWARILLTVLGGIYLLITLFSLLALGILFAIGGLGILQGLLNLVSIVVIIGAIVFQFRGESNHFFRRA